MIGALPSITGSVGRVARTVYATGTGTHTFNTSATRFKLTMCGAAGGMYAAGGHAAGGAGATEFLDLPVTLSALAYAVGAGGGGSVDGGDTTLGQWKANGGKAAIGASSGGVGGLANYPSGIAGGSGGGGVGGGGGPGGVTGMGGPAGGGASGGGSSALGRGGAGSASGGNPSTGYGAAAGAVTVGATVTSGGGVIIIEEYI